MDDRQPQIEVPCAAPEPAAVVVSVPALGFPLNAGLKTLLRTTAGFVVAVLVLLSQDPSSAAALYAVLPARFIGIFAAAVTLAGVIHNAWNNRSKA